MLFLLQIGLSHYASLDVLPPINKVLYGQFGLKIAGHIIHISLNILLQHNDGYTGSYAVSLRVVIVVIVWRPLEHISAHSFKTMGKREKMLGGKPLID